VPDHNAVDFGDERSPRVATFAESIDEFAFVCLTKRAPVHMPNSIEVFCGF
jgi:hypothetical protein